MTTFTRGYGQATLTFAVAILFSLAAPAVRAQEEETDSFPTKRTNGGKEELTLDAEAVRSIRFSFLPERQGAIGAPRMSDDRTWMQFVKDLPAFRGDSPLRPRKRVRLTPYTPWTRWNEDPVRRVLSQEKQDSIHRLQMFWQLNVQTDASRMNGHRDVPAGMDPSVTPSASPVVGGLDTDKALFETLTRRGRAIRRNRRHARTWMMYQDYLPERTDTARRDSAAYLRNTK